MRKYNFGILLIFIVLFLTLGLSGKQNLPSSKVLSDSDIKTVEIKTSEVKEQKTSSVLSSKFKTITSTLTPTPLFTQTSSTSNASTNNQGGSSGGNTNNATTVNSDSGSSSNSNNTPITPIPTPYSEPRLKGGISGQVAIGPTCPVLRIDPKGNIEPGCEDRPYSTEIVVKTQDGSSEIARTTSGEDGQYNINLNPGTYLVIAGHSDGRLYPLQQSETVTVGDEIIQVSFSLDSGIR